MSWFLTPTALLRHPAPPVFLEPKRWPLGCWSCSKLEVWQTDAKRVPLRQKKPKRSFNFDSEAPNLGELRDAMASAHEDHSDLRLGLSDRVQADGDAAHERWRATMRLAHGHNGWINVEDIAIARGKAKPWPRRKERVR